MPSLFSDNFNETGISAALADEIALDPKWRVPVGAGHGKKRYKRMFISPGTAAGIGDQLRMGQFKSNDRIIYVLAASIANGGNGAGDIGLAYSGQNHDGDVIDADLYASALAFNGGIALADEFLESGVLTEADRGLPIWEQAGLSEDPGVPMDLIITMTQAVTVAVLPILIQVIYTAGD